MSTRSEARRSPAKPTSAPSTTRSRRRVARMPETRLIMGMPITISIVGDVDGGATEAAFECFESVDRRFSPYKIDSEVSALNRGEIALEEMSPELREVLELSELTRHETQGYFDIRRPDGRI